MTKKYLTEKSLGEYLNLIFPDYEFIHNKTVPDSGLKTRPDYRNDSLNIIVEFDGYLHYTNPDTIIKDRLKDKTYSELGYRIIRIPYFVQISKDVIKNLFDVYLDINQEYQQGFIDKKAGLPASFCELGIERFKEDMIKFSYIKTDIFNSLKLKIEEKGNIELVLPKSLFHII